MPVSTKRTAIGARATRTTCNQRRVERIAFRTVTPLPRAHVVAFVLRGFFHRAVNASKSGNVTQHDQELIFYRLAQAFF